jgi:F-type H+-transporting ATPase subunit delta
MNDSKISVRYARALFESALEKGILDTVRDDMESVREVTVIPEFQYLLVNPVMKETQKCAVMDELFKTRIHPLSLSLLNLVFKNGREQFIPAIARNFIDLFKKHKGIRSATLTSVTPVKEATRKKVEKLIREVMNTPVELQTDYNEELIGGFVIRIDDQQYDASVASSLKKVKKQLLN